MRYSALRLIASTAPNGRHVGRDKRIAFSNSTLHGISRSKVSTLLAIEFRSSNEIIEYLNTALSKCVECYGKQDHQLLSAGFSAGTASRMGSAK